MDDDYLERFKEWIEWDKNEQTRNAILALKQQEDHATLRGMLCSRVLFGTAGLRARMGPGFSQLNDLVIIQTTQGLSAVLKENIQPDVLKKGVVIGFDARHNSKRFARIAANVLTKKLIPVALFSRIVPTPYVAFATRKFSYAAGIMITASHNPKDDNGYKLYWSNGAQIIPPLDAAIQSSILANLKPDDECWDLSALDSSEKLSDPFYEVHESYLAYIQASLPSLSSMQIDKISATYTPLHGVGQAYVEDAFRKLSLPEIISVPDQQNPDPDFPTVEYPNPEEGKSALDLAMKAADAKQCALIIANDPDADRLAIAEKQSNGKWRVFSGNEIGTLLGWWSLEKCREILREESSLKLINCYMLSSTVSSRILETMAEVEGFNFEETLTGFKWMGNRAEELKKQGYTILFAFEESIGYMFETEVLDKDGVRGACEAAQLAGFLRNQGKLLSTQLDDIFVKYGQHISFNSYYFSYDQNITRSIFKRIRCFEGVVNSYPPSLNGIKVNFVRDLTTGYDNSQSNNEASLPTSTSSEMITFRLANGIVLTLRTSGTEPKIKFYAELIDRNKTFSSRFDGEKFLQMHVKMMVDFLLEPKKNNLKPKSD